MFGLFVECIRWQNERPCEGLHGKKSGRWKNSSGYSWGMLRKNVRVFDPRSVKDSADSTWLIFFRSKKKMLTIYGRNVMAAHKGKTELSGEREVTGGLRQFHRGGFCVNKWKDCCSREAHPRCSVSCRLPRGCLAALVVDSCSSCFSYLQLKSILEDLVCSRHCSANAETWDTSGRTAPRGPSSAKSFEWLLITFPFHKSLGFFQFSFVCLGFVCLWVWLVGLCLVLLLFLLVWFVFFGLACFLVFFL